MDKKNEDLEIQQIMDNYVMKNAEVQTSDISEEDLKKINKLTLEPLTKDEVFVFKMMVGDNELDDRNFEPFNLNALKDLKNLYIGKTLIKDHYRKSDNQIGRIFDAELISSKEKTTGANEVHTELCLKVYMVKTSGNADLISEIKGGIKKEVSTGCSPKKVICSICGTDNTKEVCPHFWGKEYDTPSGKKTCYFTIDGCKEAYEVSLVAVPAQKRAGVCKAYGLEKSKVDLVDPDTKIQDNSKELEMEMKLKSLDSFLFVKNHSNKEEI